MLPTLDEFVLNFFFFLGFQAFTYYYVHCEESSKGEHKHDGSFTIFSINLNTYLSHRPEEVE